MNFHHTNGGLDEEIEVDYNEINMQIIVSVIYHMEDQ